MHCICIIQVYLRKRSQHLYPYIKRGHVSMQLDTTLNKPEKLFQRRRKVYDLIIDETLIKVGDELVFI